MVAAGTVLIMFLGSKYLRACACYCRSPREPPRAAVDISQAIPPVLYRTSRLGLWTSP